MEKTAVQVLMDQGVSVAIILLFLYVAIRWIKEFGPKLDHKNTTESELKRIATAAVDAQKEVAESNNNVAKSLEILNVTMKGVTDIIKLQHEDTRETQARLYAHDDRSEKMYTMLHKMYVDKYGKIDP